MQHIGLTATARRRIASVALFALLLQALLPALRLLASSTGELRAEAILATALCSKPNATLADRVAALLNPWQQHSTKSPHKHCESCLQSGAPVALIDFISLGVPIFATADHHTPLDLLALRARVIAQLPPSRAPPVFS